MVEAIKNFFLETVGKELCVFFCSMIPIIELRGAVPMGALFGLPWWQNFLICIVGNMLPVPIILLFIKRFIHWCAHSSFKIFNKFGNFLLNKVEKKRAKIEKYSFWGVTLFVGIPIPGTGAWTGSLVAAVLDMNFWKAMLSAFIGVLMAGIITLAVSYGVAWIV